MRIAMRIVRWLLHLYSPSEEHAKAYEELLESFVKAWEEGKKNDK